MGMVEITWEVTAEDLRLGCKSTAHNCPAWRGLRRQLGGYRAFEVPGSSICFYDDEKGTKIVYETPYHSELDAFTEAFDHGEKVEPRSFTISIPEELYHGIMAKGVA